MSKTPTKKRPPKSIYVTPVMEDLVAALSEEMSTRLKTEISDSKLFSAAILRFARAVVQGKEAPASDKLVAAYQRAKAVTSTLT